MKKVLTILLSFGLFFIGASADARGRVTEGSKHNLLIGSASSEMECLRTCIAAIDKEAIRLGMDISELKEIVSADLFSEQTGNTFRCKFSKRQFAWGLTVRVNSQNKVTDYWIDNLDLKGYSNTKYPKATYDKISRMYQKAKTDSERLRCVVYAIDTRLIKNGTTREALTKIFGIGKSNVDVVTGQYLTSYSLGDSKHCWRLVVFGDNNPIFGYYLTNLNY